MTRVPFYQFDAFASRAFQGNPAAVCLLPAERGWPADALLQKIAFENNLSETAFVLVAAGPSLGPMGLRWFTPKVEIDLCGHGTLATAAALRVHFGGGERWEFETRSGKLVVDWRGDELELNFPRRELARLPGLPTEAVNALGEAASQVREVWQWKKDAVIAVFAQAAQVCGLTVDGEKLLSLGQSLCVTGPGDEVDYVLRYFASHEGIVEDPVTGSAQCYLAPYWGERLGKARLLARQVSERGGELTCRLLPENRLGIAGKAHLIIRGEFYLPADDGTH
ncbi:MAG: PhzF family phenazine biosynthesis protein [Bacteriovoracia bacterium]